MASVNRIMAALKVAELVARASMAMSIVGFAGIAFYIVFVTVSNGNVNSQNLSWCGWCGAMFLGGCFFSSAAKVACDEARWFVTKRLSAAEHRDYEA